MAIKLSKQFNFFSILSILDNKADSKTKFPHFSLEKISPQYYQLLFKYYNGNKNHLELWEPTRTDNYYTLEFHINRTDERLQLMDEKKSMHFIILNDSMSEILGVCNYTKIGKGECWLGYSISSKYEGMGIMYEAVVSSNNYMFTKYPICQINAGVMTKNKRSIKLINRLSFKPTGNFQQMEINRKVERLEIYYSIKSDK